MNKAILKILLSVDKQVSHNATIAARSTGEDKMKSIHDLKAAVEKQVVSTRRRLVCRSKTSEH